MATHLVNIFSKNGTLEFPAPLAHFFLASVRIWGPGPGWETTFQTLGCRQDLGSGTGVGDHFPDLRVPSGFGP